MSNIEDMNSQPYGYDVTDIVALMSQVWGIGGHKPWKWCHIEEIWCHECSGFGVINTEHWCHKAWMWCHVELVWCHMCAKCDDYHTCCDVIDTAIHRYRCVCCHLCDDTDKVAVMSNIVGEMSGIVIVLSWKKYVWYHIYWIWCHKYNGCDTKHRGVWCHKGYMWCHAYWIWCHRYSVCDVIRTVVVV